MRQRLMILAIVTAAAGTLLTAASPNLRTFFASDFSDAEYQQKVHTKVGKSWARPDKTPEPGSKSVVIATILRDGSLLEARLHHKSGSEPWDKSAQAAVEKSAPFDGLPKSYTRTSVEVHFHFEWNK